MRRFLLISGAFVGLIVARGSCDDWLPRQAVRSADVIPFERSAEWERVIRGQESIYDEPLATDRPDFTEASSVVGRGVLQVETGYTYFHDDEDGVRTRSHSLPETLFRYGISDNIELRLVWNYGWQDTTEAGITESIDGADDLILGAKLALTSQDGWIPESALVVDMSTPTGGAETTEHKTQLGTNYLYGWDLPGDKYFAGSFGYSTGTQAAPMGAPGSPLGFDSHGVVHSSVTYGIPIVEPITMYFEYFGLYYHGQSDGGPENYFNTGSTYLVNNNLQFDARIGAGLNQAADDVFAGMGMSMRF